MGATLTTNNPKLEWASEQDIESLPKKKQKIQVCAMMGCGRQGDPSVVIIDDLVVLECFGIESNGPDQGTFQTGMINPVKYDNQLVVETSVGLSSNCESWQEIQEAIRLKPEESPETKVYAICLFKVGETAEQI